MKKVKNQYKKLKVTSRHCHVHNDISRYSRYRSSHGGAAIMQPSLAVVLLLLLLFLFCFVCNSETRQQDSHTSKTPPTSYIKSTYGTTKFLNFTLSEFTYAIQAITDRTQFMNLGNPGINFRIMSVNSWIAAQFTINIQISPVSPESNMCNVELNFSVEKTIWQFIGSLGSPRSLKITNTHTLCSPARTCVGTMLV